MCNGYLSRPAVKILVGRLRHDVEDQLVHVLQA